MKTYCDACKRSFPDDSALYNHTLRACKTCMYCTFKFKDVDEIREHMNNDHMQISCSKCQRKFFHQGGLDTHMYNQHNPDGIKRWGGYRRRNRRPRPEKHLSERSSPFFSQMEEYDSVEQFLEDMVQPDQAVLETHREVLDRLKLLLQKKTKYSVSQVFKGGSFGKGTTIKVKSDIDVVVFINDYKTVHELQKDMENVLQNLKYHIEHWKDWGVVATNVKTTRYSIQFSLQDGMIDVDLLPAVDVLAGVRDDTAANLSSEVKYKSKPSKYMEDIWRQMKLEEPDVQRYYSASFAPQQVAFVKTRPSRVKDLIRLVKHWKREDHVNIRSYCIELMVINLWQTRGEPETFNMKDGLWNILQQLLSMTETRITWPNEYDITEFRKIPLCPYVMDPANPFMNTAPTPAEAKEVEKKARIVYQLQLSERSSAFFSQMKGCGSVEQFLEDIVQPDQAVLEAHREVLHRLKLLLQEKTQYSVSQVFKGGSFGKGTTIKVKSDIDVVVFINDYKTVHELQKDMENVLQNLKYHIEHGEDWGVVATNVKTTRYSIQFSLQDGMVDVDLLPAVDVLAGGLKTSKDIWKQMKQEESVVRRYYSASFAPKQVAFVKTLPSRVKDLIRLVKHWKRTDHVSIRSYCIELMVINLWQTWRKPETFDMKDRLRDIFQQLSSMRKTIITWPDTEEFWENLCKPFVMDPENPFMNTAPTPAEAKEVEKKADIVYQLLKQ